MRVALLSLSLSAVGGERATDWSCPPFPFLPPDLSLLVRSRARSAALAHLAYAVAAPDIDPCISGIPHAHPSLVLDAPHLAPPSSTLSPPASLPPSLSLPSSPDSTINPLPSLATHSSAPVADSPSTSSAEVVDESEAVGADDYLKLCEEPVKAEAKH